MTIKRKSDPSTTGEPSSGSIKKPRLDDEGGEERSMTEKEKRKAARMIRNRQSAQISRNKKQEHLDALEATVARLQAENKDLIQRMIEQNTRSIIQGDRFVPPLSPDPSSIVEREIRQASINVSPHGQEVSDDDDDDEEDEDEDDLSFLSSSQRAMSSASPSQSLPAPSPSPQYTQAFGSLLTENATLKDRLAKLEKVVQLLLGMNAGAGVGMGMATGIGSSMNDDSRGGTTDVLRLLGPDRNGPEMVALNPLNTAPPFVSQYHHDMGNQHLASTSTSLPIDTDITKLVQKASLLAQPTSTPTSSNPTPTSLPTFPTTEIQDHARHPAAMTTTLTRSALQRACFSSLALVSPPPALAKESREQEIKVMSGFKRVLEWRTNCQMEEMALVNIPPVISSAA